MTNIKSVTKSVVGFAIIVVIIPNHCKGVMVKVVAGS